MKHRILALLLALLLVLSGCLSSGSFTDDTLPSGSESTESSSEATQNTQESSEATESTEATEATESTESTAATEVTQPSEDTDPGTTSGALTVHYIDVGQADCALVECDGKYMIIDGGNVEDSSLVVSYLQDAGVEELEAVVCSHAHEDHVGGLPGVMAVFPVKAVYSPTRTYSSNCFDDFVYYTNQQDLTIQIPKPGDSFSLGSATVTILGPVDSYSETNNTSIVLRVQYGNTRFLFTGDMETGAENDMLDKGMDVKADVLKVGHHGSSTSTGYRFLRAVAPKYGVISVGANNQYGHPDADPLSRLNDADVTVYRTDKLGHIVAVSDGTNITFSWGKATGQPTVPSGSGSSGSTDTPPETEATEPAIEVPEAEYYVGNKNSKKLHLPTCKSLPSEANQVIFETWEEAVAEGYAFCKNCIA